MKKHMGNSRTHGATNKFFIRRANDSADEYAQYEEDAARRKEEAAKETERQRQEAIAASTDAARSVSTGEAVVEAVPFFLDCTWAAGSSTVGLRQHLGERVCEIHPPQVVACPTGRPRGTHH